jgi:hypothetical protein
MKKDFDCVICGSCVAVTGLGATAGLRDYEATARLAGIASG